MNSKDHGENISKFDVSKTSHKETIEFIIEKTSLKGPIVILVIGIFIFFIKRLLIDEGKFRVFSLGQFETKILRKRYRLRKYIIYLSVSDDFKECIKGTRKPEFVEFVSIKMRKKFKYVTGMLGITKEEVKFLYCLFWHSVIINLLKYKQYTIPLFGKLEIVESTRGLLSGISKANVNINTKVCNFKLNSTANSEINRKVKTFHLNKRLKRLLYFAKVNTSIRAKPYWLIENDVPTATLKTKKTKYHDLSKTPKQRPKWSPKRAKRLWNLYKNVIKNRLKKD